MPLYLGLGFGGFGEGGWGNGGAGDYAVDCGELAEAGAEDGAVVALGFEEGLGEALFELEVLAAETGFVVVDGSRVWLFRVLVDGDERAGGGGQGGLSDSVGWGSAR